VFEVGNALSAKFVLISSRFWTSPKNRLATLMARQTTHAPKPIFLVFPDELLGGWVLPARRRELVFKLAVFLSFL